MYDRAYVYYPEALKLYCGELCNPRMALLYISYGCNFACKGCLCNAFNAERVYMDFEKFKDVTRQLKKHGVKAVEFCGGGEPLLHPDVNRMITWLTDELHMSFGLMTNGSLLNEHLDYLLATRANYVRVSLYENSYDFVMKKVLKLIDTRDAVAGSTVIGVKFLVNEDNQAFILQRLREVSGIPGINHISVKAMREEKNIVDYSRLEKEIRDLHSEKIVANLEKSYLKGHCWMSPIHTLIDPEGEVYICCYYMERKKEHCIGNVFEKSFDEIWGSPEHLEKLRHIDTRKCNVYDCRWHQYNEKLAELLSSNSHHQFC